MYASSQEIALPTRVGLAVPVAKSVAHDLAAILNDGERRAAPRRRLAIGRRRAVEPVRRRDGRAGYVGLLVAVACLGVSAGALMSGAPRAGLPGFGRAQAPAPQLETPIAAQLPIITAPATSVTAAVKIAPADLAALEPRSKPASEAAPTRKASAAKAAAHACGADRRCSRSEVMAADRRLRQAYAAAVSAGVARPVLVEYRNDWASLRRSAPRQPARVVAGYGRMAGELERLARVQRIADERPVRREDGWRRMRHEIASLLP